MSLETGWERRSWRGAAGLREERGRARRRLRGAAVIAGIFVYGLFQVWVTTEVAERNSRIARLQGEIKKLQVDLTVSKARLEQRQIYGDLMTPAERFGFGPGGEHRFVDLATLTPVVTTGLWDQMVSELQRGSRLLLPEALAQDRWVEGPGRAHRP